MDLVYIPDHKTKAREALLSQYRDRPNIEALVASLATGAQMLEDQAFDLLVSTTLTASHGASLDHWGALVGEARGNLTDDDYRRFVNARILVNNSTGTTDEILAIWSLLTEPFIRIEHRNYPPATFQLNVLRDSFMGEDRVRRIGATMRAVKPAGVAMMLIEAIPGYFGFEGDPDALPLDVGVWARAL